MRRMNACVIGLVVVALGSAAGAAPALADGARPARRSNFQQDQRINALTMQFGTDSFAPHNALGGAIASAGQSQIQSSLTSAVNDGSLSFMFEFPHLEDLTGTDAAKLQIGALDGTPVEPAGNPATYNGASDLDWWYSPNPAEIDDTGTPLAQLSGSIASHALTASGSEVKLTFGGLLGTQSLSSVALAATTGASSAPLESTNGFPPGHLVSEHIPATLQSFASMTGGNVRGNVSAASMAATPIPSSLLSVCANYTAANTLLDVFVSGCKLDGLIAVITPVQPDQVDPNVPVVGAGGPYSLAVDPANKQVDGCTDVEHASVSLADCLGAAAYSAYFTFTTDRVIVQRPAPVLTLTPSSGAPGAALGVAGSFFVPGGTVKVTWATGLTRPALVQLCTATVASDGTFSCATNVPKGSRAGPAGPHVVAATEKPRAKAASATATFTIAA